MAHSEDASEGINILLSMNVGSAQTGRNPLDDDCKLSVQIVLSRAHIEILYLTSNE